MKRMLSKVKKLKINDFIDIPVFLIAYIVSRVVKIYWKISNKKNWIISEDGKSASDNGYCMFKFIREKYPNKRVYYIIDRKSEELNKVKQYGNIIYFRSFKHWIYYLACEKILITDKVSSPSLPIFYVLESKGFLKNKRIFLQHGITINDVKPLHYKNSRFALFICGAETEYKYVLENFGFKEASVKYTGFARFDNLNENAPNIKNQIIIMPTWRKWICTNINNEDEFMKTQFFKQYQSLLKNKKLIEYINKNKIGVYFYLHRNMQKFVDCFESDSSNIHIIKRYDIDIQKLIKESSLMITDYSSVSMDFAYLKKPVFYYQFDCEEFRDKHLKESYFSYKDHGFGEVISNENELVEEVIKVAKRDFKMEKKFKERINSFFVLNDNNNCERIYREVENV